MASIKNFTIENFYELKKLSKIEIFNFCFENFYFYFENVDCRFANFNFRFENFDCRFENFDFRFDLLLSPCSILDNFRFDNYCRFKIVTQNCQIERPDCRFAKQIF
jgi:hypothetical protein